MCGWMGVWMCGWRVCGCVGQWVYENYCNKNVVIIQAAIEVHSEW